MATDFDAYELLGVSPSAGQIEIDEAYRRLTSTYPTGDRDEHKRALDAAYRLLSDPDERRAYDERRAAALASAPAAAPAAVTPEVAEYAAAVLPPPDGPAPWGLIDILLAIAIVIGVGMLGGIPFVAAASLVTDGDINDDSTALGLSLIGSAALEFAFLLAVWLRGVRKYHLTWEAIGLRRPRRGSFWLPFALFFAALATVLIFSLILDALDQQPDTDLPERAYRDIFPVIVLVLLTIGLAPWMEEVFFRGFVFPGLSARWGVVLGIIGSGALFGSAHLLNPGGEYVIFPIALIGMILAWGTYWSKSIYPSIAAHFMFNGVQIAAGIASPPEDDNNATIHIARALYHVVESGAGLLG